MRYFLRPVDSEGGAAELIGPFVTLNLNDDHVDGFDTHEQLQRDEHRRIATFHEKCGWGLEIDANKPLLKRKFYEDLEIVVKEVS